MAPLPLMLTLAAYFRPLFLVLISRQLPTYSGTKSYQNLLVEVYGGMSGNSWSDSHLDAIIQANPVNLVRSSTYDYNLGRIRDSGNTGYYWHSRTGTDIYAWYLYFDIKSSTTSYGNKGNGRSIRCLVR